MSNRKNPETSNEAYRSLDVATLNDRYKLILDALAQMGEGITEEVAAFCKVKHEIIWKRFSELSRMGLIYRPGNKRLTKNGRNAYTWMLTNSSVPKTQNAERALKADGKDIASISRNISDIGKSVQPELFKSASF